MRSSIAPSRTAEASMSDAQFYRADEDSRAEREREWIRLARAGEKCPTAANSQTATHKLEVPDCAESEA